MRKLTLCLIAFMSTLSRTARTPRSLTSGDWVGQIGTGDNSRFIRIRFGSDTSGRVDFPLEGRWGMRLTGFQRVGNQLSFVVPVPGDTLAVTTSLAADSLTGRVQSPVGTGTFRAIHRMPYDSSRIRPLAGTYRISGNRDIAMGPLDEADGWLSFFDTKTRRAGILYSLDDSTLFTGPSFGVDFPVAIRATIARNSSGQVTGLRWHEADKPVVFARRSQDIRQEDVVFYNGNVRLVGNVTAPTSPGSHRAVVLIHGCCGRLPTRDFGYWSSYLAHHGIVVLAYDRRGGGASTGDANAPYTDIADDVVGGVHLLEQRPDVDPARVGVFGMSNGGYIAPLAATRSNGHIAFVAVRSGSARRVGNNIDYEVEGDLRSAGFNETDVRRGVALRRRVTDFVIDHPKLTATAWDSLQGEVAAAQQERWYPLARVMWVPRVSAGDSGAVAYVDNLRSTWEYDPVPYWSQVRVPVYIMLGGLDRSVPTAESVALLREALARAGNKRATVRIFPSGNHGLLEARTGFDAEARLLDRYVADFQAGLVRWILDIRRP
jgi:dienelactone hydrolase